MKLTNLNVDCKMRKLRYIPGLLISAFTNLRTGQAMAKVQFAISGTTKIQTCELTELLITDSNIFDYIQLSLLVDKLSSDAREYTEDGLNHLADALIRDIADIGMRLKSLEKLISKNAKKKVA